MATHYQGNPHETAALNAYIALMRCAESLTRRLHVHLDDNDLTISQFGVLEALLHLGPLSQTQLARKLLKTGGNLTLVIDNLEKRQLVERERQEEDRRVMLVRLTTKGRKLISLIFPHHVQQIVDEMGVLTQPQQAQLRRLCRTLGLAVQADRSPEETSE